SGYRDDFRLSAPVHGWALCLANHRRVVGTARRGRESCKSNAPRKSASTRYLVVSSRVFDSDARRSATNRNAILNTAGEMPCEIPQDEPARSRQTATQRLKCAYELTGDSTLNIQARHGKEHSERSYPQSRRGIRRGAQRADSRLRDGNRARSARRRRGSPSRWARWPRRRRQRGAGAGWWSPRKGPKAGSR